MLLHMRKGFWKMDWLCTSAARSRKNYSAPPDDGIFFIDAKLTTVTKAKETTLEPYCIDVGFSFSVSTSTFHRQWFRTCNCLTIDYYPHIVSGLGGILH